MVKITIICGMLHAVHDRCDAIPHTPRVICKFAEDLSTYFLWLLGPTIGGVISLVHWY